MLVPWRDPGGGLAIQFTAEGYTPVAGEENPRARLRLTGDGFFSVVGVRLLSGSDFTDEDRPGKEPVSIVSESLAQRMFPSGEAINRHLTWGDVVSGKGTTTRIVGVVADIDDQNVVPERAPTIYLPVQQMGYGGRLFVRAGGDPYAVVPAVTRLIREMAPEQPVERAATLEDVRAQVLAPERVNAFVFSGFAGIALLIAVVGVAGVLAFSVSARPREFGIRLAVGSAPRHLLARVLSEGVTIAATGIAAGAVGGYAFALVAARFVSDVKMPGVLPVAGAGAMLIGAAVAASLMPAARASRVDVLQALRSE